MKVTKFLKYSKIPRTIFFSMQEIFHFLNSSEKKIKKMVKKFKEALTNYLTYNHENDSTGEHDQFINNTSID